MEPPALTKVDWRRLPLGRLLAGLLLSAACLALAFRQVSAADVLARLSTAQPLWIALTAGAVLLGWIAKTLRWQALLCGAQAQGEPAPAAPLPRLFETLLMATLVNILVPVRLGDLLRVVALNYRNAPPKATVLGTIAVEKLIDLLITGLLAASAAPLAIQALSLGQRALVSLALVFVAGAGLLALAHGRGRLLALLSTRLLPRMPARLQRALTRFIDVTLATVEALARPRALARVAAWSAAVWTCNLASLALLLAALRIDVTPAAVPALSAAIQLGYAPPSAPGFITEIAIPALVLQAFGVAASSAAAYGVIAHALFIGIPVLLGAYGGAQYVLRTMRRQ